MDKDLLWLLVQHKCGKIREFVRTVKPELTDSQCMVNLTTQTEKTPVSTISLDSGQHLQNSLRSIEIKYIHYSVRMISH